MSRRPAAIPAAPPPTITTSVSLLATRYSAPIWIETCASIERPIVPSQRCPFMSFQCRYCHHAPRDRTAFCDHKVNAHSRARRCRPSGTLRAWRR
jgi:hypothetical protein